MIYVSILAIACIASYAIWRVRREFIADGRLSVETTILVWVVYLVHAGLTGVVAWEGFWPVSIPSIVSRSVGSTIVVIGIVLVGAGIRAFRSLSRMSGMDEDELVTTGVYRWSRNPQNTGWILILTGVSILGQSTLALVLVGLLILPIHVYLVFVEEPHLANVFGPKYQQYRSQTPRYLGLKRTNERQLT